MSYKDVCVAALILLMISCGKSMKSTYPYAPHEGGYAEDTFQNPVVDTLPIGDRSLLGTWKSYGADGKLYLYAVGYQENGRISGARWDDTLVIPFVGSYDTATREIFITEKGGIYNLPSAYFTGKINHDVSEIGGVWYDNNYDTVYLTLKSTNINYNDIILTENGSVNILIESSSALYHGSFGIIYYNDSLQLCEDYKNHIGETFTINHIDKGTHLKFYIHVYNTGMTYYSSNYDHAIVVPVGPNTWRIKWEDSENIDRDFDDLIVKVYVSAF